MHRANKQTNKMAIRKIKITRDSDNQTGKQTSTQTDTQQTFFIADSVSFNNQDTHKTPNRQTGATR